MKTRWIGITGVALILAALVLGTLAPYVLPNAFRSATYSGTFGPGMMNGGITGGNGMMGGGVMGGNGGMMGGMMNGGMMGGMMNGGMMNGGMMGGFSSNTLAGVKPLALDDARAAVTTYLAGLGNGDLAPGEVMIFDNHAYAQVIEKSTSIGAFEVLVDPVTQAVVPEPGPNMMWNRKYSPMSGFGGFGMMAMMGGVGAQGSGGMMGGATDVSAVMPVSPDEAVTTAQRYLDTYLPGAQAGGKADAFYGYYTIHILRDGKPAGMLSVNGVTRQVVPHTWHGDFVEMAENTQG